jgi:gamma-glutamyl:cysteine ligase YbdK (ATP-grasp superfamily)
MLDRAGIEIEFLAVLEHQAQSRRTVLALIDAVAAEHQQVHPQRRLRRLDQEMLAPAAQVQHRLSGQRVKIHRLAVAAGVDDGLADQACRLLAHDNDRWSLWHVASSGVSVGRAADAHCTVAHRAGGPYLLCRAAALAK